MVRHEEWGASVWPSAGRGWVGLAAALVGLGSWIVLPLVTTVFRERYPITDTYVMPFIGLALVTAAAILNALILTWGHQRSAMNVVATISTAGATVFFGVFVIGEWISGA